MTLEELKKSNHIIFECISGSRAYGLDTPTSDTDIKGVFILPKAQFYSLDYIGQINNETNDIVYYELRKFIELCLKNNPNILEMLYAPADTVLYKHKLFDEIKSDLFLSKLCEKTFANYAFSQIKKARGLNKKIVNPIEKERKDITDFCTVLEGKKNLPLKEYLTHFNLESNYCGLAKIPNMKNCFNFFYNKELNYQGIARENANEVCVSSIPKSENPIAILYFNSEGYSSYCKKYKEYWNWVAKRNEVRYKNNVSHDKNYDAKNMMHTFRLLRLTEEIAEKANMSIRVSKAEKAYLFRIKNAEFEYDDLINEAEKIKDNLEKQFKFSELQEEPDKEKVNNLLVDLRVKFYREKT